MKDLGLFSFLTDTSEIDDMSDVAEAVGEKVNEIPGLLNRLNNYVTSHIPDAIFFCLKIVLIVIIFFIGTKVIKHFRRVLRKSLSKSSLDTGFVTFVDSFANFGMYFLLILMLLGYFGVTASAVTALLGSAGLTAGLALQGGLSNFAGGVMIILNKPFVVGDYIKHSSTGLEGTVTRIQIFYTKLLAVDNSLIVIPNGDIIGHSIINYSNEDKRVVDLVIYIKYDTDVKKAKEVFEYIVRKNKWVLEDETVTIFVKDLEYLRVNMGIRVWVKNDDYYPAKWSLLEELKAGVVENGL